MEMRSVLCATDFSESAAPAIAHATRFAQWYGAPLVLLHVSPVMDAALQAGPHLRLPPVVLDDATVRLSQPVPEPRRSWIAVRIVAGLAVLAIAASRVAWLVASPSWCRVLRTRPK